MPFVIQEGGKLEYYAPPKKKTVRPQFNSVPLVIRVLRNILEPGREYHAAEIFLLANESRGGQMLNPGFRGGNAQKLLDKLVRNGKMAVTREGFYTLAERE